jgi:hypothetical protein
MLGSHNTWQLRRCGSPLISTRHSKHVPMPQRGPRGSPETEVRQAAPEINKATTAVAPAGTTTATPFTVTSMFSGMYFRHVP